MPSQEGQEGKQVWRSGLGNADNKVGEEGVRMRYFVVSPEPLEPLCVLRDALAHVCNNGEHSASISTELN